jgi:hypothetical protein
MFDCVLNRPPADRSPARFEEKHNLAAAGFRLLVEAVKTLPAPALLNYAKGALPWLWFLAHATLFSRLICFTTSVRNNPSSSVLRMLCGFSNTISPRKWEI